MSTALSALRALGLAALLGFLACALTPLPNRAAHWMAGDAAGITAGAIVVLGADAREDGTLGDVSLRRTVVGLQQHEAGAAPLIVFTGASRASAVSEAVLRQRLAVQFHVPAEAILVDDRPLTTHEEARAVRTLLEPRQVHAVLLVTDSLHARRARSVFEREGFRVGTAAADSVSLDSRNPEDRLRLARSLAQQAAALLVYKVTAAGAE